MIDAIHYTALSLVLLCLGLVGVMMRRNAFTVLMSLQLMFVAAGLNLVAYSFRLSDLQGQVLAAMIVGTVVAESVIGIGLMVALIRLKDTADLDDADEMRG